MSILSTRTRSWLFTPATRPERFAKASVAGAEPLASRKWYWFGVGAILLAGIVVALGTAAGHRDAPNFADAITRICAAPFRGASAEEAPFLSENVDAMTRMMADMEITPSGDVDADFAAMMIPHHQGEIDMAQAELRQWHNEQLRRMAKENTVT